MPPSLKLHRSRAFIIAPNKGFKAQLVDSWRSSTKELKKIRDDLAKRDFFGVQIVGISCPKKCIIYEAHFSSFSTFNRDFPLYFETWVFFVQKNATKKHTQNLDNLDPNLTRKMTEDSLQRGTAIPHAPHEPPHASLYNYLNMFSIFSPRKRQLLP